MEDSHNYSFFQEKYDNDNGNQTSTRSSSLHFRQQMAAFIAMTKIYFKENSQGRWMFFGLIVLMLLNSAVRILFSYLARDFWTALGDQDADEFYRILRNYIFALLFLAPVNVFYRFQRQRLAVKWREWMTTRMLQLYYTNRVYYTLERLSSSTSDKNLDNPDQRIAEDVRAFTTFSLSLFLTLAVSLIDLSCFSVILYTIEPPLFLSIIAFAAVGTLATVLIGKQLFRLNFDRLQKEADFRYSLVRIRENAESIAFFRGEKIEGAEVQQRFSRVIGNSYDLIGTQRNLDFFTTLYNYVTWILPVLVIAPQYFQGNVELGVIQQASSAFGHVLDDLSVIINEFESLSEFSASIDRLHQFVQAIRDADPECDETMPLMTIPAAHAEKDGILKVSAAEKLKELEALPEISGTGRTSINLSEWSPLSDGRADQVMTSRSLALSIRNLHLTTPDQQERSLIRSLDLDLRWGERLLITGSSGVGKSSLLRAVAGLWTSGSGFIQRAHSSDVYFLPQKPYCPLGSLRDQLLYPSSSSEQAESRNELEGVNTSNHSASFIADEQLLEILAALDLPDLALRAGNGNATDGLDRVMDWSNTLSLGEQQRLAFGRVLINRPRLLIMDESTSAMDVASETRMYTLLRRALGVTATYISVGHRPTLLSHHDIQLQLRGGAGNNGTDQSYTLLPIQSSSTVP